MTPGRLRHCLKILRWSEAELADALGLEITAVKTWIDGREYPPLVVAAWLEALAKVHQAVPLPWQQPPQPALT